MEKHIDVIVVGAGSTGGVLAARLSEDPDRSVLLLEAGPVYRSDTDMPPELLLPASIAAAAPGHPNNWGYPAEIRPGLRYPYPRGKGLGGSSSINGCYFIRGTRKDFDTWAKEGNDLWAFDRVVEMFKRCENDLDFAGEAHGHSGPIPVMREPMDRAPEFTSAFTAASLTLGFGEDPDKNDPRPDGGVGPVPLNIQGGRRVGTALGYLLPAMARPNLTVTGGAVVLKVIMRGKQAVGVTATVDGELRDYYADEVVLSAGALRSPHLLMVSGIGPARELTRHGIQVHADLSGVGANLTDHPMAGAAWTSDAALPKLHDRGLLTSALHWRDEGSELEILPFVSRNGDMLSAGDVLERPLQALSAMRRTSIKAVTRQAREMKYARLGIVVLEQESRGSVTLTSSDPTDLPEMKWNLLSSGVDRARFRAATRTAFELFQTPDMKAIGASVIGLDAESVRDDRLLDQWVAEKMSSGHPACTCRMGPESDPTAVVDQELRVRGVSGLRVADTSVFPTIPVRGPNATAIMVGEQLAELMARPA